MRRSPSSQANEQYLNSEQIIQSAQALGSVIDDETKLQEHLTAIRKGIEKLVSEITSETSQASREALLSNFVTLVSELNGCRESASNLSEEVPHPEAPQYYTGLNNDQRRKLYGALSDLLHDTIDPALDSMGE